ncbi:ComF family protein [Solimonas terrae]|uniref:ComF family protein n=1 Tax=Solimonas terrae TaxID=1396819 RepID=A0A6M2BSX8_9GAMM|nr:ComF family protein [Solimonas terrae]NGY05067.1 ComF family protein [Solimonas terrae]
MVDIFTRTTGLVLPLRCTYCSAACEEQALCDACRRQLPWNRQACPQCALPQTHDGACAHCLAHPPPYLSAWAPLRLEAPVQQQIHALKYHAAFMHARLLGRLFADSLGARTTPLPDLVLPVPLHAWRQWRRGYNQSVELARAVCGATGLRLEAGWARRLRRTADQIGMDAVARRRNVAGAFRVDPGVRNLRVALLDDVMTTGATLAELARSCRRAGAAEVEAWAIARVA